MNKYEFYYEKLKEVSVIDTHEHLWDESWRLAHPGDWSSLFSQYCNSMLRAAGMPASEEKLLFCDATPHTDKWRIFSKYYPFARNTAVFKAALTAIKDIYGIEGISCDSMEELTRRIKAAVKPGFNRKVLKDMGGVDYCMNNSFDCDENGLRYPVRDWGDAGLLKPDLFADGFIFPTLGTLLEGQTGVACDTLDGWLKATDVYFERYAPLCCSIKIALGYRGPLDFRPGTDIDSASRCFRELYLSGSQACHSYRSHRPLVDFMFFRIVEKAAEYHLPLKFHTGLYSGNETDLASQEGNVRHLAELAVLHPECRFVAMHIAYPFQEQLAMAVGQIPNLYADMSWAWVVDTKAASDFLRQVLTAAPVTKVTGFGGDYALAENAYGHLELARRSIAAVLSEMEASGWFDRDEAAEAGRFLLRESASILYSKTSE